MAINTLKDLRAQLPPEAENYSDEALVAAYAKGTGQDLYEVADYFGIKTGVGRSALGAGFSSGIDQVQAMGGGLVGALGDVTGLQGLRDAGEKYVRQQQAEAALARNPNVPQRIEDVGSVGEFGSYFAGQLGQQIPIMGGILGAAALTRGVGLGAATGALGTGYTYGAGSLYNESVEGGQRDGGTSLLKAIPYAAAESLVPLGLGRLARGAGIPGISSIASRPKRVAAAGGAGTVAEAATELAQTELEMSMRDDLTAEEKASRRLNALVAGGLVGGAFTGAAATFGRRPQETDTEGNDLTVDTEPSNENITYDDAVDLQAENKRIQREALTQALEAEIELDDIRRLADSKLPAPALRDLKTELKLAQEQLEATETELPTSDPLIDAKARLASLNEEINRPAKKGESARRLRVAQRARAAETADERAALEAEIASLQRAQYDASTDIYQRKVLLEEHIRRLQDQIDADAEATFARRALQLMNRKKLTVEQVQADIRKRLEDRLASLSGVPIEPTPEVTPEVAPEVSPVVAEETLQDGIDLAQQTQPATQPETAVEEVQEPAVEPVQAASPVVEEELVTAEDIEAESQIVDEKAADVLKAQVSSNVGKASGQLTLGQQVLRGAVEMMRSTSPNPKPVVRQAGKAAIDAEATEANAQRLTAIHEAFKAAVIAARKLNNARQNLVNEKQIEGLDISSVDQVAADKSAVLQDAIVETKAAMDALVQAADNSPKNVDALIAIFKKARQDSRNKSYPITQKIAPYMKELFGDKSRKKDRGSYLKAVDSVLSNAWAAYKDNALDTATQSVPEGREKRLSNEEFAEGYISDLEAAMTEGEGRNKDFGKEIGLRGVLNYISQTGRGTPRVGTIALRKLLIDTLRERAQDGKVAFTDEETSYYDPKTDTVFLRRKTNPEEIVHEALHAALQGYVYRNKTAPEVELLKNTLDDVIDFVQSGQIDTANMSATNKQQALDVVNELIKVRRRSEIAAVLELISYGNTMAEFKELTTKVKARNADSKKFLDTLNKTWRYLTQVLSKFLGVENKAANDILNASVSLLNKARKEGGKPEAKGAKLRQQVSRTVNPNSPSSAFNIDVRDEGQVSDWILSTKFLFDLIGWDKRMKWTGEKLNSVNKVIRKEIPGLEKVIRGLNPYYGLQALGRMAKEFKSDKHTGYLRAEEFASIIRAGDKALVEKMFKFLDEGPNSKSLDGVPEADKYKTMLNSIREFIADYTSALSDKQRAEFLNKPLSESLFFVEKLEDVGSQSFGLRKVNQILGRRNFTEVNLEDDWIFPLGTSQLSTDSVYYEVIRRLPSGETRHEGFIHKDVAASYNNEPVNSDGLAAFEVVPDLLYKVKETTDGKYIFNRQMSAKQALEMKDSAAGRDKLAHALLNTVGTLANFYASKGLSSSLYNAGRADGQLDIASLTAESDAVLAFDSIQQLNEYLKHYAAIDGYNYVPKTREEIRIVTEDVLKTGTLGDKLAESGVYVQFPSDSDVWGDLAGAVVPGPVFAAIRDASSTKQVFDSSVGRKYNSLLRFFKQTKTIYNPGTHVTNVASNVTIAMIHGINRGTVLNSANMLRKYYLSPEKLTAKELALVNGFMNSGAVLGDFSTVEVKQAVYDAVLKVMNETNDKKGAVGVVLDMIGLEKQKSQNVEKIKNKLKAAGVKTEDVARLIYASEDNMFRFAAFLQRAGQVQTQKGSTELTAEELRSVGIDARNMFLDYDIDSRYLQAARQTVLPFASWTYAIMPVLTKSIITQPWRIANIMTAYAALDMFASMLAGEDEEYRKQLGSMYSERVFGIGPHAMIRIPFLGSDEQPVYYRLGDYLPLSTSFKGTPNGFLGMEGWPSGLTPTGPILSAVALAINMDPYTGKKVIEDTDGFYDGLLKTTAAATDIMLPPLIASKNREKLEKFASGEQTVSGKSMSPVWALRAMGLKFYDPYISDELLWQQIGAKKIMREYKTAMSKARREAMRTGGAYDAEALQAELDRLNEAMLKEVDEVFNRD